VTQLLAITAAALYGVADFAGGLASRSNSVWRVTAWSQLMGMPLLIVGVVVVQASEVTARDLTLGAFAGAVGLVGLVLMYSALATGTMSIVAPVIGALAAAIAVGWDVATGGTIEPIHWIGIAMSIGAVALLASQPGGGTIDLAPMLKAIGAAVTFAAFFIAMSHTNEASALWPLVAARAVTVPVAFLFALATRVAALPKRPVLWLIVFTGVADMGANLAIMIAVQRGPLGINAVLSSLYPTFTVLAAFLVGSVQGSRLPFWQPSSWRCDNRHTCPSGVYYSLLVS
jgi:drug/metabolite transporter (DMT)-like permease